MSRKQTRGGLGRGGAAALALGVVAACGGGRSGVKPDGAASTDGAAAACDGPCSISFVSGTDWDVYTDDPVATPTATLLGKAELVCAGVATAPGCPAGAVAYGKGTATWGLDL